MIRGLALAGVLLCFSVVVLGAYVRLTDAGLGCPDWPGCYGHLTPLGAEQSAAVRVAFPSKPLDVGKAWREMIHRYAAGTLGLNIVVIAALAISCRRAKLVNTAYAIALLGRAALRVQIALGGWTSSNYAAVACPDFPRCQNAWWPHTDYGDAFVLWRGLALNYEGGVLDNPARVAIHLTHRLGAVVTTMALGVAALFVIGRPALSGVRISAYAVLAALALQLAIGV